MELTALSLLAAGWAASKVAPLGRGRSAPLVEDPAHAEMRAAGHRFGETVVEAWLAAARAQASDDPAKPTAVAIADHIRERAARWSERLRNDGVNPRLTEHLVTTWVAAAHQASRERLRKAPRHASSLGDPTASRADLAGVGAH
jgi:hypothetical protein